LVQLGGEWFYSEYAGGRGVSSLGVNGNGNGNGNGSGNVQPEPLPPEEERNRILDLFKN
jgi:penicillin-binding protein 1A